jgi:hypothetical protein
MFALLILDDPSADRPAFAPVAEHRREWRWRRVHNTVPAWRCAMGAGGARSSHGSWIWVEVDAGRFRLLDKVNIWGCGLMWEQAMPTQILFVQDDSTQPVQLNLFGA